MQCRVGERTSSAGMSRDCGDIRMVLLTGTTALAVRCFKMMTIVWWWGMYDKMSRNE